MERHFLLGVTQGCPLSMDLNFLINIVRGFHDWDCAFLCRIGFYTVYCVGTHRFVPQKRRCQPTRYQNSDYSRDDEPMRRHLLCRSDAYIYK